MAADTFSALLGVLLMGTGNDNNTWGANANTSVFQIFEDAIAGILTLSVTGGTLDLSGTPPPAGPSQVRYAAINIQGTLTGNQTILVPNLNKTWWVRNATSGAFTVTIETPAATFPVVIPQNNGWQIVRCSTSVVSDSTVIEPYNTFQVQMPDGSVGAPPFSFKNETNSGFRRAGTQDIRLVLNGSDVLQITGPSASTPNVANFLSPLSLQQAGVQVIPAGTELPYAGVTLPAGFLWSDGQAVSRTSFPNLLAALRASFTGTTSNGSPTITSVGADLRNLGLEGAVLEGNGVTGLTINSITSNTITLSGNASASNTITILAYPWGRGDGSTTFNVPDRRGRVIAGRDNMGNPGDAAAGRLTSGGAGINGVELTAAGGSQTQTASTTLAQANLPNVSLTASAATSGKKYADYSPVSVTAQPFAGGTSAATLGYGIGGANPSLGDVSVSGTTSSINGGVTQTAATSAAFAMAQPTGIGNYIIKT